MAQEGSGASFPAGGETLDSSLLLACLLACLLPTMKGDTRKYAAPPPPTQCAQPCPWSFEVCITVLRPARSERKVQLLCSRCRQHTEYIEFSDTECTAGTGTLDKTVPEVP